MEPGMFPEPLLVQTEGGIGSGSSPAPDTPSPPNNRYKRPLQVVQDDSQLAKRTRSLEAMEKTEEEHVNVQQALLEELQAKTVENGELQFLIREASGQLEQFEILTLQQMKLIREQSLRLELQRELEQNLRRDIALCQLEHIEQMARRNRELQQLSVQLAGKRREVEDLRWQIAQPLLQQLESDEDEEDSASSEQQLEEDDNEEDSASSVPRARQTQSV